jgi:hypothetical protein
VGWTGLKYLDIFLRDEDTVRQLAAGDEIERLVTTQIVDLFELTKDSIEQANVRLHDSQSH